MLSQNQEHQTEQEAKQEGDYNFNKIYARKRCNRTELSLVFLYKLCFSLFIFIFKTETSSGVTVQIERSAVKLKRERLYNLPTIQTKFMP